MAINDYEIMLFVTSYWGVGTGIEASTPQKI
jgi:hypothetical protein